MSVATTFLLIRHAAHDFLGKVLVGRTPAVHLNAEGQRQAAALAAKLSDAPLVAVYSSPLERAFETAQPIAATRDFELQFSDAFNEIDFGIWTGKSFEELDKRKDWQRWNRARALAVAPGGEKMWLAQRRAVYELESMCGRHRGECVAVVSHCDVIRAVLIHYRGMSLDLFHTIEVDSPSVTVLSLQPRHAHVRLLNDDGSGVLAALAEAEAAGVGPVPEAAASGEEISAEPPVSPA